MDDLVILSVIGAVLLGSALFVFMAKPFEEQQSRAGQQSTTGSDAGWVYGAGHVNDPSSGQGSTGHGSAGSESSSGGSHHGDSGFGQSDSTGFGGGDWGGDGGGGDGGGGGD